MAKKKTPSFVIKRKIYVTKSNIELLENALFVLNRMYNTGVRHYRKVLKALYSDIWFRECLDKYHEAKLLDDETAKDEWASEINACLSAYKLLEFDIHEWYGYMKVHSYEGSVGINIVQKLGSQLYSGIKKCIFDPNKTVHFRKYGQTTSFEDKKASSGIIYKPKTDTVSFHGVQMKLKPIRKNDWYIQEAMKHRIKYCRIKKEPSKTGYNYYLELVMEGIPPIKYHSTNGETGIDPGVSTMSIYGDNIADFVALSPDVSKYEKEINRWARSYERIRRNSNPENYNEDGTIKKNTQTFKKVWKRTKGEKRALARLRNAYRRKAAYIREFNGHLSNQIAAATTVLKVESMNYKVLARRAKETSRKDKAEAVKKKDGSTVIVHKYKKKKRFGSSISRHAPSQFIKATKEKVLRNGGVVLDVEPRATKCSQYNHVSNAYEKNDLKERSKIVGGRRVQRDFYSAFLIKHADSESSIDRKTCVSDFNNFLWQQQMLNHRMIKTGDPTGNYGLVDIM